MASSKDIPHSSRPISQNRPPISNSAVISSLPKSHGRNHSHSISSASHISSHRVTRRKSVSTNNATNYAAIGREFADSSGVGTSGMFISTRRNTISKGTQGKSTVAGNLPSPPASLPHSRIRLTAVNGKTDRGESAIEDDQNDDEMDDEDDDEDTSRTKQSRGRRASEGQHLVKDGNKKGSHSPSDLKCEKCGKGYKHSSCLSKHLWEHTPEWSLTSKLLISKHQQVLLLEAASVLLTMNQDGTTPPDSAREFDSKSPAASSEKYDPASSADTTPPPPAEITHMYSNGSYNNRYHLQINGHSLSRSYQSAPSNYLTTGSVPSGSGFSYYRSASYEKRPTSSGISHNHEDDGLAAAVELLSCSFGSTGTPRSVPVTLPDDAPPVPNIPAQYLNQDSYFGSTLTPSPRPRQNESYTRTTRIYHDEDVRMEESGESAADDDEYDRRSRDRSDEDDDGVFGRMEE